MERRWLDDGLGRLHGIVACVAMAALAVTLFVLGRLRSDRIQRRANDEKPNRDTAPKPVWLMVALAVVVVAGFTWVVGGVIRWWAVAAVVVMLAAGLV